MRMSLASAALRHIADATMLYDASPVGALHLAGFGPECARKAALAYDTREVDAEVWKYIGHGIDPRAEEAARFVFGLDPLASRYPVMGWRERFKGMKKYWHVEARYLRSDAVPPTRAARVLNDARTATTEVIAALWADGRLEPLDTLVLVQVQGGAGR